MPGSDLRDACRQRDHFLYGEFNTTASNSCHRNFRDRRCKNPIMANGRHQVINKRLEKVLE